MTADLPPTTTVVHAEENTHNLVTVSSTTSHRDVTLRVDVAREVELATAREVGR